MRKKSSVKSGALRKFICGAVALLATDCSLKLLANPQVMTVVSGSATPPQQNGSQLNVTTTSPVTFLKWSSFDIQAGETTTFIQPSANSVVINQIGGANPSQIFGNLNANGTVILANANGFYFGPNSMISVGGSFIATTAPLTPDFGAGSAWHFTGMPPLKSIVNYGQVKVGAGKSLYLIADQIQNNGSLTAPGGDVGLFAGQEVLLNERADGRGFSASVKLPAGAVDNEGNLVADAGTIALQAKVVNQNGIIQANSVQNVNGVVELVASDQINIGADSLISAAGDHSGSSAGGTVTIKSENEFSDQVGSVVNISGGSQGGNGGQVEISAPQMSSIQSSIHGEAAAGFVNGVLTIDPLNILLVATGGNGTVGEYSSGTVNASDLPAAGTLTLNINSFASGLSEINLQAANNIELSKVWTLADAGATATLNLTAGNNITLDNGAAIVAGNNWSVNLNAGTGFVPTVAQPTPASGNDGIHLNGSSFIQTQNGDISLSAMRDVTVTSGFINTASGGNISVNATFGDINAGNNNVGYNIGPAGLSLGANVGGISTLAGGNVTLDAGNNVISVPNASTTQQTTPGASGAYGGGDVTVVAGNRITGNYLVSAGRGKLEAGVALGANNQVTINNPTADIGLAQQGVTLSLISGNWDVFAARNIYLSEVNNPNGTFNANSIKVPAGLFPGNIDSLGTITLSPAKSSYLFNYAPDSRASLWAGNAMTLGNGIYRLPGQSSNTKIYAVYPPNLSLEAGVGGITIDTSINLYPSSQGSLSIVDGGNLSGVVNLTVPTGITMSDSGLPGFATFAKGHAVTPLHLNDPNPVTVDVAGSIGNFSLTVPTFADITVGGTQPFTAPNGQNIFGTYNFQFSGQNLASSGVNSVTSINVAGDIIYQGLVTQVPVNPEPGVWTAWFIAATSGNNLSLAQYLTYNSATGVLSFRGAMDTIVLTALENVAFNGTDSNGNQQTALTVEEKAVLNALYTDSQGVTASASGIFLNGPGRLSITAQNMDLGTSGGIQVNQKFMPELSVLAIDGASLDINLSGNLEITTTSIGNSGWLGGIQLNVGGWLDLGLQSLFGAPDNLARGIYTTSGGDISVTANGNVDVNGSRIAAYDGGNVMVTSLHGDVNAGSGGSGDVEVETELQLGLDGKVTPLATGKQISGSGILAYTDGASTVGVGNVTVQALQGSINANLGGIEQIPFNHIVSPDNFIELVAGKDISAGNSGVIGSNIRTTAGGNISGVFVGSGAVSINAGENFSGTIVGSTTVSVAAGGSVSGTIVGGENVSVSGGEITASLLSGSVSTSGDASGATVGIPQSNATKQDAQVADDASTAKADSQSDDNQKKKKPITLAQKVGRVTVNLPTKTN